MRKTTTITFLTVLSLLVSFSFTHAQGWYNANWEFRKAITIDSTQVDTDLTNFPVLIDIIDTELADGALATGYDILFTDDTGTDKLDHEIEYYDKTSETLVAWVEVPLLDADANTTLYMYYGNTGVTISEENVTGTWNGSNYVMVQHLEEIDPLAHNDSTSNDNDSNVVTVTDQAATGNIDGADEFNGSTDYVRVPDDASLQFGEGSFTAEAWINPQSVPDSSGARIVNNRGTGIGGEYAGWHLKIKSQGGSWLFSDSGIDDNNDDYKPYVGTPTYAYNAWYHVVMVYEADTEMRFYVNGVEDGALTVGPYGSISNSLPTVIGASLAADGVEDTDTKGQFFDGIIDEVRLSNIVRDADWIETSYNNQKPLSTFATVGTESDCAVDADCDDGDFCTGNETCVGGVCQAGSDPCSDDGDFCNGTESCDEVGDQCLSTGDPCPGPDGDANCSESCNETTDNCTSADPNGAACNDDTYCNGADTCNAGACSDHVGDPCPGPDGDNNCSESCNEAADNCTSSDPNGSACNDDTYCNGADTCNAGACSDHVGDPCPGPDGDNNCSESCNEAADNCTSSDPNGAACNDDTYCNGADTCNAGACSDHVGDPCPGPDGDNNCSESCNEAGDNCTSSDPNGTACNDDTYCNGADTCNAGACSDHEGDPCTDDLLFCTGTESCDEAGDQCVSSGDPCVSLEVCDEDNDVCELPSDCVVDGDCDDDGIGCTDETCDAGTCVSTPNDANCSEDGTFCNGIEYCDAALDCSSPGDPCVPDPCDEVNDICITTPPDWWDASWLFRKKITIDPAKVDDDLTDFPVLIDITDDDLATYAQSNGDDLAFTDDNVMQLSHEIELYDDGTGHVVAWVRVPSLSSTEDTVLYLYFGNSTAGNQEDVAGTWDSGYVMVQHLDETSDTHFDSTINENDGTPVNVFDQGAMGKIDGADEFDDPLTPSEINVGTNTSMDVFGPNQDFSIFLWVKRASTLEVEGFFSSGSDPAYGIYFGSAYENTDDLKFMSLGQTVEIESITNAINDTEWHLVGVTADRDGVLQLWIDGELEHSESIAGTASQDWNRADDTYKIATDRSENSPLTGLIDEVRLSQEVRSDGWIQTSYTNQNDPGAFYLCGPIEAEPDTDGDGSPDGLDNCPNYPNGPLRGTCTEEVVGTFNVNWIVSTGQFCTVDADCGDPDKFCEKTQADHYPPGGNGIGDACDCEADFDCDEPGLDVDAVNVEQFLMDFGRSIVFDPCTDDRFCYGDFNCDGNVDADDIPKLLEDFGRNLYENKCPAPPVCVVGDWCVYP